MEILLSIVLVISFILCVSAFGWGIKVGRQIEKGIIPNLNPIKAVKKIVEKIEEKKEEKELDDIMSVSRETLLKNIRKEQP